MRHRERLFCPQVARMGRLWGGRWILRFFWRCRWGMGGLWMFCGLLLGLSAGRRVRCSIFREGLGVGGGRLWGIADGVFHMVRSLQPMFRSFC